MYQAYPGGADLPEQQQPAPGSVLTAVKLMYAGAAVSLLGLILSLATVGSIKAAILKANPSYTTTKLHAAEGVAIGIIVAEAIIGVALWIWMALANKRGRSWARIVASVLFGLNTLVLIANVSQPHASVALLYNVVLWLIGLAAIVLLWRRQSSAYFQARSPVRGGRAAS